VWNPKNLLHRRFVKKASSRLRYGAQYLGVSLNPRAGTFYRPRTAIAPRYKLAICTRVKNEGRFLPEFVAHHVLLGFEHVYIYDNNSTDEPEKVLAPFLDRQLVSIARWPEVPAAPSCYRHFFETFEGNAQWVGFFDADEFLVEREDGALSALLAQFARKPAIGINSRWYGSSGHLTIPRGLVMEAFPRCSSELDEHVKVLLRPATVLSYFNSHNFIYRKGRLAVDVTGQPILGSLATATTAHAVELNHYLYRSREDYITKTSLGFVDSAGYRNRARRIEWVDTEFNKFNDADGSWAARKYAARVGKMLADLGYPEDYWRGRDF
jgi:hypothetical protein